MHPAGMKSCSSLKLFNETFWQLQAEFCVILWTVSHQVLHSRFWRLITANTQNIGFSTRKVFMCYFYVLNVHLGGLIFMKFNVTEKIKYCLSHFICSLISIYTYPSAWNLFMMSKQTKRVKKKYDKLSHIGGWRICLMLHDNFTQIFKKNILISQVSQLEAFYLSALNYKY